MKDNCLIDKHSCRSSKLLNFYEMGATTAPLDVSLVMLKGQSQGHSDFEVLLYFRKGSQLSNMLVLNTKRKSYMGIPLHH